MTARQRPRDLGPGAFQPGGRKTGLTVNAVDAGVRHPYSRVQQHTTDRGVSPVYSMWRATSTTPEIRVSRGTLLTASGNFPSDQAKREHVKGG